MATLESINRLLSAGTTLLERAATEIRDAKLESARENIESLGKALAEVFEIQHKIYKLQPKLTPKHLDHDGERSAANRLLTGYMYNASEFERAGNIERAIDIFQEFLVLEASPLHRDIAAGEIERLRNAKGT